jgi:hypothetical protein
LQQEIERRASLGVSAGKEGEDASLGEEGALGVSRDCVVEDEQRTLGIAGAGRLHRGQDRPTRCRLWRANPEHHEYELHLAVKDEEGPLAAPHDRRLKPLERQTAAHYSRSATDFSVVHVTFGSGANVWRSASTSLGRATRWFVSVQNLITPIPP